MESGPIQAAETIAYHLRERFDIELRVERLPLRELVRRHRGYDYDLTLLPLLRLGFRGAPTPLPDRIATLSGYRAETLERAAKDIDSAAFEAILADQVPAVRLYSYLHFSAVDEHFELPKGISPEHHASWYWMSYLRAERQGALTMRVRTYGLILLGLAGIAPLAIYGGSVVQQSRTASEAQVCESHENLAQVIVDRIETYATTQRDVLHAIGIGVLLRDRDQRSTKPYELEAGFLTMRYISVYETGDLDTSGDPGPRPGAVFVAGGSPPEREATYRNLADDVVTRGTEVHSEIELADFDDGIRHRPRVDHGGTDHDRGSTPRRDRRHLRPDRVVGAGEQTTHRQNRIRGSHQR